VPKHPNTHKPPTTRDCGVLPVRNPESIVLWEHRSDTRTCPGVVSPAPPPDRSPLRTRIVAHLTPRLRRDKLHRSGSPLRPNQRGSVPRAHRWVSHPQGGGVGGGHFPVVLPNCFFPNGVVFLFRAVAFSPRGHDTYSSRIMTPPLTPISLLCRPPPYLLPAAFAASEGWAALVRSRGATTCLPAPLFVIASKFTPHFLERSKIRCNQFNCFYQTHTSFVNF